jgi:proteasome alpha subunit
MRGYAYDRRDVTGRGLANAYAQTLGTIFSSGGEKPYEVEIFVAEVGDGPDDDQIYRLTYQGQVTHEHQDAVMGGADVDVAEYLREHYTEAASLSDALHLAVAALGHTPDETGATRDRVIPAADLEVAVLDRTRTQPRKFLRLMPARLESLLGDRDPAPAVAPGEAAVAPEASGASVSGSSVSESSVSESSVSEGSAAEAEIDPSDVPDDSPPPSATPPEA